MEKAIITYEAYGNKVSIETAPDNTIHEVIDHIYNPLVAAGFHYETVNNGFIQKAEDIKDGLHTELPAE